MRRLASEQKKLCTRVIQTRRPCVIAKPSLASDLRAILNKYDAGGELYYSYYTINAQLGYDPCHKCAQLIILVRTECAASSTQDRKSELFVTPLLLINV